MAFRLGARPDLRITPVRDSLDIGGPADSRAPVPETPNRLRRTAAACSKRYDPLFWHDVKGADGLGSPRYQTGTVRASTGRVWTGDVAELRGSWETAKFHTVGERAPRTAGSLARLYIMTQGKWATQDMYNTSHKPRT
jgi:hypothetical protein